MKNSGRLKWGLTGILALAGAGCGVNISEYGREDLNYLYENRGNLVYRTFDCESAYLVDKSGKRIDLFKGKNPDGPFKSGEVPMTDSRSLSLWIVLDNGKKVHVRDYEINPDRTLKIKD